MVHTFHWGHATSERAWTYVWRAYVIFLASVLAAWTKTLTLAITFKPEERGLSYCTCSLCQDLSRKIMMATFRGMQVSPAKHSYAWLPRKYDYRTDRQILDKVIPMCCYASRAHNKSFSGKAFSSYLLHKVWETKMTLHLTINTGHLLINHYLPSKFEASWANCSWCICCTRFWETNIRTDPLTNWHVQSNMSLLFEGSVTKKQKAKRLLWSLINYLLA